MCYSNTHTSLSSYFKPIVKTTNALAHDACTCHFASAAAVTFFVLYISLFVLARHCISIYFDNIFCGGVGSRGRERIVRLLSHVGVCSCCVFVPAWVVLFVTAWVVLLLLFRSVLTLYFRVQSFIFLSFFSIKHTHTHTHTHSLSTFSPSECDTRLRRWLATPW